VKCPKIEKRTAKPVGEKLWKNGGGNREGVVDKGDPFSLKIRANRTVTERQ